MAQSRKTAMRSRKFEKKMETKDDQKEAQEKKLPLHPLVIALLLFLVCGGGIIEFVSMFMK